MTTDQSLSKLFSIRGWHKNSGIREGTARAYKKRFLENTLEMETRIKILTACGFKIAREMQWEEKVYPSDVKGQLVEKLKEMKVFWSYDQDKKSRITDETLIESTLMHLDSDEILHLFKLYPVPVIKKIWRDKMLRQEPQYHGLNRLYALWLFSIKDPDRYINDFVRARNKELQCKD